MLHEPTIMPDAARESQVDSLAASASDAGARAGVGGRPPTVRRSSGAPSFGQCRPGPRAEVRSPVCEPPRLPRIRSVSRIARCSRFTSSSARSWAGRAGSMPARQSASSQSRLPRPAMRDWSMITAFTGARLLARIARSCARVRSKASGPRRSSSGSSSTAPRRRGSRRYMRAAVGERHPEAVPRGIGLVARVEERIAGGLVVDQHAAAHAEVQSEHRAARHVDQDELAAPARVRERLARAARRAPRAA